MDTMSLPSPSEELCFTPDVFLSKDYSVDEFVSECRRHVTVEHLHQDLQSYYSTLKAAMVELINKDYADFLDLSANLVGMDKQIEGLTTPLTQLHQEIMGIKTSMSTVIEALEKKMATRATLRNKKATLRRLIFVFDTTEHLEQLLSDNNKVGRVLEVSELDRVAMEFNKLRHNTSLISDHPAVKGLNPRMIAITDNFQSLLENLFINSLSQKDHQQLLHTLETYSLVCCQSSAEELFRNTFVRPYMEQVISAKSVLTHPQGISGVFLEVLKFIPKHCRFLLEVCNGLDRDGSNGRFDFLVNGVWPEVASLIEAKAGVIFAPGNPDNFYKNYTASMQFLSQFESHCRSIAEVKRLRSHPSYTTFINKWSLPVYFQIRFQEIAGQLESLLELPLKKVNEKETTYSLEVFATLSSCLNQCWSDGIYLSSLIHRFWKLTLQLIIRVGVWLNGILDGQETLSISDCIQLVQDIRTFSNQSENLMKDLISPKLVLLEKTIETGKLEDQLKITISHLRSLLPKTGYHVTDMLKQQCCNNLEPVQTIPRLFRRTNREVPFKPSGYVVTILKPLSELNITGELREEWMKQVIEGVTERYHELTSEVLSNVKRTEDSLLKLKRSRKSLIPETSNGISDDNKIRIQLSLDIESYINQVVSLFPSANTIPSLTKLKELAAAAKTIAFSTPSSS